jgi:hypothetical protein
MACTIDHLRADARVVVLQDFTDLAGVVVRAGEVGVVRGLGLDYATWEVWIDLERGGATTHLRFALRATAGPRNGHMRTYFEVVPDAAPAKEVVAGESAAHAPAPGRDAQACETQAIAPAAGGTTRVESRVGCGCDAALQREVLSARGGLDVWACLRCGAVSCTRVIGDDGRFTGDAWYQYVPVVMPAAVERWIGGWPRVRVDHTTHVRWPTSADLVRYETLHYPADVRCADRARLATIEEELARAQAGQSWAERLRATQRVTAPPPAGLPNELRGYELLWQALQLTPQSDLELLLHHAQLRSPGSVVAAEVVRARADVFDVVEAALRSDDSTRRGAGFAIARDWRTPDPRLEGVLIELLETLPLEPSPDAPMCVKSRGRGELLLLLVAELRLATPAMLAALRERMRAFGRRDDFLANCARLVVQELKTAAPSQP